MYQSIARDKNNYDTILTDKTWTVFDKSDINPETGSGNTVKATMVRYYDNKVLKYIKLNTSSYGDFDSRLKQIEYYFDKDSLFFVFIVDEYKMCLPPDPPLSSIVSEQRLYFNDGQCIRYLVKEVEGKPEEINNMLKNKSNIEIDCFEAMDLIEELNKYLK